MANNEERFCNHCGSETLFFLESDLIWYCDECGNPFDSEPVMDMDSDEYQDALEEFEEEFGEAIYCRHCGNFITVEDALEDEICGICGEQIDEEQLENKGYSYDEEAGWIKDEEEADDEDDDER